MYLTEKGMGQSELKKTERSNIFVGSKDKQIGVVRKITSFSSVREFDWLQHPFVGMLLFIYN